MGLSVDELADRTRIRPHVIESIEVDDFTPCGGDFYARGHIRTLARVLGKDPAPMLAHFDSRYATAPGQPPAGLRGRAGDRHDRQHAQHASGARTGPCSSAPCWPWCWSGAPCACSPVDAETASRPRRRCSTAPPGSSNGFGEPRDAGRGAAAGRRRWRRCNAGANVEVRDGEGALVFEGDLVIGEVKRLEVRPAGHRVRGQRRSPPGLSERSGRGRHRRPGSTGHQGLPGPARLTELRES